MYHKSRAFTLIELIIGITILSLLAVALLAALDPIEQINKARDTAKRNLAVELHGAYVRYNANKEAFPAKYTSTSVDTYMTAADLKTDIGDLIAAGELKPNFLQAAGSNLDSIKMIRVSDAINGEYLSVCFKPSSKLEIQKSGLFDTGVGGAIWTAKPTVNDTCKNTSTTVTGRSTCVYCAQ